MKPIHKKFLNNTSAMDKTIRFCIFFTQVPHLIITQKNAGF